MDFAWEIVVWGYGTTTFFFVAVALIVPLIVWLTGGIGTLDGNIILILCAAILYLALLRFIRFVDSNILENFKMTIVSWPSSKNPLEKARVVIMRWRDFFKR